MSAHCWTRMLQPSQPTPIKWFCGVEPDHEGPHQAMLHDGTVAREWPNRTTTEQPDDRSER